MDISFGLFGLLYLALVIWAILSIAQSRHGVLGKAFWLLIVLVFQPLGAFIWLFLGPRANAGRQYPGRQYHRHSYSGRYAHRDW